MTKVVKPFIKRGWPNTFGNIVYLSQTGSLELIRLVYTTQTWLWVENNSSSISTSSSFIPQHDYRQPPFLCVSLLGTGTAQQRMPLPQQLVEELKTSQSQAQSSTSGQKTCSNQTWCCSSLSVQKKDWEDSGTGDRTRPPRRLNWRSISSSDLSRSTC